ncbi:hypothetical protein [Streptomyces lavendulae]|uniref:hypothetical protein n=1 Tax=Streptomyces lavendulae TaxID=1914 RepID=UPI0031E76D09
MSEIRESRDAESGITQDRKRLTREGRNDNPFQTNLTNRHPDNLDQEYAGADSISLSRHHIVPFSTLQIFWNLAVRNYYNDPQAGGELREALLNLSARLDDYMDRYTDLNPSLRGPAKTFVAKFRNFDYYHDETADAPNELSAFLRIYQWIPGNLFVGPEGRFRTDDPKSGFEYNCAPIIGSANFARSQGAWKYAKRFNAVPTVLPDQGVGFLKTYGDIAGGRADYWHLHANEWEKSSRPGEAPKYTIKRFALTGADEDSPSPSETWEEPGAVIIGGKELKLGIYDSEAGLYNLYWGSLEDVEVGDVIDWVSSHWPESVDSIPDSLRSLRLRNLTLEVESGPGANRWHFTVAAEDHFGESRAVLLIHLDRSTATNSGSPSNSFELSAEVTFEVQSGSDVARMWFEGEIAKTGNSWELNASWESDTPLPLFDLFDALGLSAAASLRDFLPAALQPELRSVSLLYGPDTGFVVGVRLDTVSVTFASVPVPGPAPGSEWCVQVTVSVSAGLADLPVVGKSVPPAADLNVVGVRGVYAPAALDRPTLSRMNQLVDRAGLTPFPALGPARVTSPDVALPAGGVLGMDYQAPSPSPSVSTLLVPLPASPRTSGSSPAGPAPVVAP